MTLNNVVQRVISQGFNANDVIICEGTDGQRWSTDWVVYYGTKVKFWAGYKTSTAHCSVSITVNGSMLSDCYMQVGKDGYCVFPGGHKSPPRIVLHTLDLIPGLNVICYEVKYYFLVANQLLITIHSASRCLNPLVFFSLAQG